MVRCTDSQKNYVIMAEKKISETRVSETSVPMRLYLCREYKRELSISSKEMKIPH